VNNNKSFSKKYKRNGEIDMYEHNMAYRFNNGDVKGYKGTAFTKEVAKENAIHKIRKDIQFIPNESFDNQRVLKDKKELTEEEFSQIQEDWNMCK
jgi:hypothetical protein